MILPNADVATMKEMVLKSVENAVSFRFLGASQVIVTFEDQLAVRKEKKMQDLFCILYSVTLGSGKQGYAPMTGSLGYPYLGYRWKVGIGIVLMLFYKVGEILLVMTRLMLAKDPY
ncbi:hypothetical protein NC651_038709 [Populus alba x Populus x berolinensis]|nr:hypothetical protein NC651_038709 [Populus alba x Populus x berolinensis]